MWTYNQTPNSDELYHYGVPGMKWGVRKRYLNSNGSLNARGIKKYARKAYAKDSLNSNKTRKGKAYDVFTGAHKISADIQYSSSSKKQNKARAEQYLKDRQKTKSTPIRKKLGKAVVNRMQKNAEKRAKHDDRIKKTTDLFGVGGVALGTAVNTGRKFAAKKTTAHFLNSAANAYKISGRGSYAVNRGVDFARKLAIDTLSVSAVMDVARGANDVRKASNYAKSKGNYR